MSITIEAIIGSDRRGGAIWTGIFVVILLASILAYRITGGFIAEFVGMVITAIAFVIAAIQAYRNGSVLLSWFISMAPALGYLSYRFGLVQGGFFKPFRYLLAAFFFGTTAHILGTAIAESRGTPPREVSDKEQQALVVIIVLSGAAFVYYYVAPLY